MDAVQIIMIGFLVGVFCGALLVKFRGDSDSSD